MSPGYVWAPRVTQVQQHLSIDIIFVKMVPFLLMVFTPLVMASATSCEIVLKVTYVTGSA
jgi:hypothetical protein